METDKHERYYSRIFITASNRPQNDSYLHQMFARIEAAVRIELMPAAAARRRRTSSRTARRAHRGAARQLAWPAALALRLRQRRTQQRVR